MPSQKSSVRRRSRCVWTAKDERELLSVIHENNIKHRVDGCNQRNKELFKMIAEELQEGDYSADQVSGKIKYLRRQYRRRKAAQEDGKQSLDTIQIPPPTVNDDLLEMVFGPYQPIPANLAEIKVPGEMCENSSGQGGVKTDVPSLQSTILGPEDDKASKQNAEVKPCVSSQLWTVLDLVEDDKPSKLSAAAPSVAARSAGVPRADAITPRTSPAAAAADPGVPLTTVRAAAGEAAGAAQAAGATGPCAPRVVATGPDAPRAAAATFLRVVRVVSCHGVSRAAGAASRGQSRSETVPSCHVSHVSPAESSASDNTARAVDVPRAAQRAVPRAVPVTTKVPPRAPRAPPVKRPPGARPVSVEPPGAASADSDSEGEELSAPDAREQAPALGEAGDGETVASRRKREKASASNQSPRRPGRPRWRGDRGVGGVMTAARWQLWCRECVEALEREDRTERAEFERFRRRAEQRMDALVALMQQVADRGRQGPEGPL